MHATISDLLDLPYLAGLTEPAANTSDGGGWGVVVLIGTIMIVASIAIAVVSTLVTPEKGNEQQDLAALRRKRRFALLVGAAGLVAAVGGALLSSTGEDSQPDQTAIAAEAPATTEDARAEFVAEIERSGDLLVDRSTIQFADGTSGPVGRLTAPFLDLLFLPEDRAQDTPVEFEAVSAVNGQGALYDCTVSYDYTEDYRDLLECTSKQDVTLVDTRGSADEQAHAAAGEEGLTIKRDSVVTDGGAVRFTGLRDDGAEVTCTIAGTYGPDALRDLSCERNDQFQW